METKHDGMLLGISQQLFMLLTSFVWLKATVSLDGLWRMRNEDCGDRALIIIYRRGQYENYFCWRLDFILLSFNNRWNKRAGAEQAAVGLHLRFSELVRTGLDR